MASNHRFEPNKFIGLRKAIASLSKDIGFLSRCKSSNVTPKSHRIKIKSSIPYNNVKRLENELITHSIRTLRAKLDRKTLEAYNLHLKLAQEYPREFPLFLTKVKIAEECESERKRKILQKKHNILLREQKPTRLPDIRVQKIENFVVNQSSQVFTEKQMDLLNKGLNYAINSRENVQQVILDVEAGINAYSPSLPITTEQKESIRSKVANVIRENKVQITGRKNTSEQKIITELRRKPVFYVKADKGNALVILDKDDYDDRMRAKIANGPYRRLRADPLPRLVSKVTKTIKECKQVIGNVKLTVPNPVLPRIKGLPKIHKPGQEMREIVSAVMSPTHRIAKWLVDEFRKMEEQFETRSVKNSKEFAQHIKSTRGPEGDEIMVSFDVKALFPSIPVKEAIGLVENWLLKQKTGPEWRTKVRQYLKLVRLCMEENYFTFRGECYKQLEGAPMGNPLSPFISEIFMANLESDLASRNLIPRVWKRYVDDVFAIIKETDLKSILSALNNLHGNIQFTCEVEKQGKLPFLDLLLTRTGGTLELEIYRKPTDTCRVIPNTSNHTHQHKMAAFNHMIHRMLNLPISQDGVKKETAHIFKIAELNGYPNRTISNLINKRRRMHQREILTNLIRDQQTGRRVAVTFNRITASLKSKLKENGVEIVYTSKADQLKTLLKSTKDPIDEMAKSGVYRITCTDCRKIYIGQTRRNMETRLKEHLKEAVLARKKNSRDFRSKVAEHIVLEDHNVSKDNATIVNHITDWRKLDVAESLEIYKSQKESLLNKDIGNGYSSLFCFVEKYKTPHPKNTPINIMGNHTTAQGNNTIINENTLINTTGNHPTAQGNNTIINGNTLINIRKRPTEIPRVNGFTCPSRSIKRTIPDFFPQSCLH